MPAFFCAVLIALLLAWPGRAAASAGTDDAPLLLEVRLRQHQLSDALLAWPTPVPIPMLAAASGGSDAALPLGELARLLTLAIRVDAARGSASGYLISEDHPFSLDLASATVNIDGKAAAVDVRRIRREADELYVPLALLQQWLPVDLSINLSSLVLSVTPRAPLPLEAALARRERAAQATTGGRVAYTDPGFPRQPIPYALAAPPFVDQTLAMNATHAASSGSKSSSSSDISYSAYATADLAGMQASLFTAWRQRRSTGTTGAGIESGVATDLATKPAVNSVINSANNPAINPAASSAASETALRLTLARIDPDAGLLGPLHARTVMVGSVPVAGLDHVSLAAPAGNGILIGNRPSSQSSSFDRHTLQGELAAGWDVELFYNEALIGYQGARDDGRYSFDDLPLAYGPNEFRLVFHGPLGQLRVEKHSFLLEQSAVAPGALYYVAALQRSSPGAADSSRALLRVDAGILPSLSASAAVLHLAGAGTSAGYAQLGLHAWLHELIASVTAIGSSTGGRLGELGLKTRIGGFALAASRAVLDDFYSDVYLPLADPVRRRDEARLDGALLALPLSLVTRRDTLASGSTQSETQARLAWFRDGAAISNAVRWHAAGGVRTADGNLGMSWRRSRLGFGAQLQCALAPRRALSAASVTVEATPGEGLLASVGITRQFTDLPGRLRLNGAVNAVLGRTGLALGLHAYVAGGGIAGPSHGREFGLGLRLFSAIGFEPRQGAWRASAQAMAASGAASVRVFIDQNQNGVYDPGEPLVAGAALTVNGARHSSRTGADGIALLERLPVNTGADLAIDSATLADPRWVARAPGLHIVPRPGVVARIDLAVALSGDIDGSAWLPAAAGGARRAAAGAEVRLLDAAGKVAARVTSGADGYYLFPTVLPGDWRIDAGGVTVAAAMNADGDSLHLDVETAAQAGATAAAPGL